MRPKSGILLILAGALALVASVSQVLAQDDTSSPSRIITFYVNEKTGQVFIRPGKGRVPMVFGGAVNSDAIEHKVEEKSRQQVRAAVAESEAQQKADTADLQKQVAEIKPAWKSYVDNFQNKFRLGATLYADYGLYPEAGFGPQQNENLNPPGTGNNFYNSFDITRVYLNTYFFPTDDWTFRFTPEIYRANGANQTTTSCETATFAVCSLNDKFGSTSAVGSNLDGSLSVRLKYAYLQYKGLLDNVSPVLKGATFTMGAQPNPFIPWEEDLYGYRFVNLVPWNYLGFSSSQIGIQADGPIKLFGGDTNFAEYSFGVYDNGSFRTPEQTNTKQVIGRVTVYPFGANWRFQGLGLTGMYNYGWGNTTPDNQGSSIALKGGRAQFQRMAAVLHYAATEWNIAGEFDYGKNAFQLGNLFSGSGPADAFGTPTGTSITTGKFAGNTCGKLSAGATPCYPLFNTFGPQTAVYQAILNNGRARQWGVDLFGHYHIPGTKLSVFGMYQWFLPNDQVELPNPLDFQRFIAGISYQYNEYLTFALDSQNLLFYHNQEGVLTTDAAKFGYVGGSKFNGWFLPKTGGIPNLVPRDQHAIFANIQFVY
jgi:hypothetical protein